MKTVYFNVLPRLSTELSTKTPKIRFASKKIFFLAKTLILNFANHFQDASQVVWNPLILTFYPVSVLNYLQKTPKIRFASKKLFFLAKKLIFKFCLFLSRGNTGGMKTVYFIVLSRLSTELSTKNIKISFC